MSGISLRPPVLAGPDVKGLRIPERSLELLRDLVAAQTGMFYDDGRLDFLRDRLAPLAIEHGFDSFLDYYYLLKYDGGAADAWVRAIDALSVQETYFWREADQITALADVIVPQLVANHSWPVRIWSVPCASGEEPLSMAIALEERGWFGRVPIEIHGSDASEAALQRARAGRYGGRAFRQLPEPLREKYFAEEAGGREWTVKPDLHRRVKSWTRLNVVQRDQLAVLGGSNVIFCRNLFIYFTAPTVAQVVEAFADLMASPAYLCVGAAESLLRLTTRFELREIGGAYVYCKS
ncbi:MAG TPA: protein-glutamate O-methyltransferase CheR [Vicinamibacterales bacterium]|jgi:chemotaxis protein methyltransferase CheR|nr:protein-glutamate O-methyltransferase CheR [Vicinamibacterales bacterium]